jgi:endonuclease/exonuclease/phosphatase family metal-dependent hydrolase
MRGGTPNTPLRIVTWNCCRGPRERKLAMLASLHADIAVVQECPRPDRQSNQSLWFGDNDRQGVAVIASGEYRLRRLKQVLDVPAFAVPVAVTGPASFTLLAVWAKATRPYRYVQGVVRAVDLYRRRLARTNAVVLGDFNSNRIWDHEHPPTANHSALVDRLGALGMRSCYHTFFDEPQGAETTSTFHLYRRADRPYHLDYCFAPQAWLPALRDVTVGDFATWMSFSDHRPIIADFTDVRA